MHARARDLIASLGLEPHPEGGHYREVFRSAGLTTIFFLLAAGDVSRWHRVLNADEAWHFYEGEPLELVTADDAFAHVETRRLGPSAGDTQPVHVVSAGQWQAARPLGAYTLVGCSVGPAFQFDQFEMLRDRPDVTRQVGERHPAMQELI